jgi:coatomer subunit beta
MLNGERFPSLLMNIIRFVMPNADHKVKKLLLVFWEIVPKSTPDGKLLQEMILVCDAYRWLVFRLRFDEARSFVLKRPRFLI